VVVVAEVVADSSVPDNPIKTTLELPEPLTVLTDKVEAVVTEPAEVAEVVAKMVVLVVDCLPATTVAILEKMAIV
jgi:hypothetical protein